MSADEPETPWPIRILHLHSSFSLGGKEARAVRLMNLMGDRAHHTILSAMPEALGARDAIDPGVVVDFPADAPPLHGKPSLQTGSVNRIGILVQIHYRLRQHHGDRTIESERIALAGARAGWYRHRHRRQCS